jgi:hypothetical protein
MEKIIEKIVKYLDEGKNFAEILNLLTDKEKKEAKEIIAIIKLLKEESKLIVPRQKILIDIVHKISSGVTNKNNHRISYIEDEKNKGRLPLIKNVCSYFMGINKKLWLPVGIIVAGLLLFILVNQFNYENQQPIVSNKNSNQSVSSPEGEASSFKNEVANNIDEAVNAILASVQEDQMYSQELTNNLELVLLDNQTVEEFSQIYNENEF